MAALLNFYVLIMYQHFKHFNNGSLQCEIPAVELYIHFYDMYLKNM